MGIMDSNLLIKLLLVNNQINCPTRFAALQYLHSLVTCYGLNYSFYLKCIYNNSSIDVSLLRYLILLELSHNNEISVSEARFFCLEIDCVERPYQLVAVKNDDNRMKIIIRGTTVDTLLATGSFDVKAQRVFFELNGESDWHKICMHSIYRHESQFIGLLNDICVNWNSLKDDSNLSILLGSYSNIGHALRNELGPFFLSESIFGHSPSINISNRTHYNLTNLVRARVLPKDENCIELDSGTRIWLDSILPTGSNPILGKYASRTLNSHFNSHVSDSLASLKQLFSDYQLVIFFSPRFDRKRGLCLNQDAIYDEFVEKLNRYCRPSRVLLVYEKHYHGDDNSSRCHNQLIDNLMAKHRSVCCSHSTSLLALPLLTIEERLDLLSCCHCFVGAAGANTVTYFDWQCHEVPGIMYGDYNLIVKGKYFSKLLISAFTGKKIVGRYVLFGTNVNDDPVSDYHVDRFQIELAVSALVKVLF